MLRTARLIDPSHSNNTQERTAPRKPHLVLTNRARDAKPPAFRVSISLRRPRIRSIQPIGEDSSRTP